MTTNDIRGDRSLVAAIVGMLDEAESRGGAEAIRDARVLGVLVLLLSRVPRGLVDDAITAVRRSVDEVPDWAAELLRDIDEVTR